MSFVGLYLAGTGQRYLLSWVGQKVLTDMRSQLYHHILKLSLAYHDTSIIGVTVSRVINDVAEINELLSQGVITLFGDLLVLGGIVVIMLSMEAKLALLTLAVLPLIVVATALFARRARSAFRETRLKVAAVVGDLAEDLSGIRVIQAFAQEAASQERFERVNRASRNVMIQAVSLSFVFLPSVEFLGTLSMVIVLGLGGVMVAQGQVTLGVLVAFLAYVMRFFQPVQEVSRIFTTLQSALAGGEQVFKLLDTLPDVANRPNAGELPAVSGRVEMEHVTFRYRDDLPEVLHDVSLMVEPGQTVALVGPTGAGKTSIAKLVARLYDVSVGSIRIDGIDVREVTTRSLRRQVILMTQDPFLFSTTIAENIRFGRPDASQQEVEAAAQLAYAHDFILSLPDGYNTVVAEGAANLSVGQRQLLCIARAILADPRLLILDESTANIDTVTEKSVQAAMRRLLRGRTAIIIAHRLSTVQSAEVLYVIDDGRVVDRGRHPELLRRKGLYQELYKRQFAEQVNVKK
jgi:ABC-type multidrug transport system fused ATPase/permease subunit